MANPSYASTIVQLAYSFAQELNRFYQEHKEVIDQRHMVPNNLLGPADIARRDVNNYSGVITLRFEEAWEDWSDKDEEGTPKVKGLIFSVDVQIDPDLHLDFICNTSDTYESISTRFQRVLGVKIMKMDSTIAKMKMMLSSLENLN